MNDLVENAGIKGTLVIDLIDKDGNVKQHQEVHNLITQYGDQYYAERAAGLGSNAVITGMQLGTGVTAAAKTGGGAAIGTLVAASLVALATAVTSTLSSGSRRLTYTVSWAAGVATNAAITEIALVNQSTGDQSVASSVETVSRAVVTPINKSGTDILNISWMHDFLGA